MTEERIERFFCNACKQKTKHFIRGEYNKHDGDAAYWYKHRMLIIECCGWRCCKSLRQVDLPLSPACLCHAFDLGLAKFVEAVHEGHADVELGCLAVGIA